MADHNPYEPPNSDWNNSSAPKNSVPWKTFFWITAAYMTLVLISIPMMPNLNLVDYADFLLMLVSTLGLYGFAYYKPIHSVVFWRYFFYVLLVESIIISIIFPLAGIAVYGQQTAFDYFYLIGCLYMATILYAIYQYAYRRNFIWSAK